jgi:hypothetical protein
LCEGILLATTEELFFPFFSLFALTRKRKYMREKIYFSGHLRIHVGKVKAKSVQAWTGPEVSRMFRLPEFQDSRHVKVVKLSTLCTGRLYPQEIFLVLISVRG